MSKKPKHKSGYEAGQAELVKATCLYVATKLGDLMEELVIVGGLAPSLLIDQQELPNGVDPHVGTLDLDVGLTLALLDEGRYKKLSERLRDAGFVQDENDDGEKTRQRWKLDDLGGKVTLDFLIQPSLEGDKGGKLRNLEPDFAAIIAPGLKVAFIDRVMVTIDGTTIYGAKAKRDVWVCNVGAFVVLKALAFGIRAENKDAYDLFYVLRNYGVGVDDVVAKLLPILDDVDTKRALEVLRNDFTDPKSIGPRAVADFVSGGVDEPLQADVVGFVTQLLAKCRRPSTPDAQ
jgi:hypothetical protein